jgi:hypothetical protein
MDEAGITEFIAGTYRGVRVVVASKENGAPEMAWGDSFFIADPNHELTGSREFPFATIVTQDYGEFDNLSNLNRPGVFRLNIGVGKQTFDRMFPDQAEHDFAALDVLMPHPVYGTNHWVAVLNPSDATFQELRPLLDEAYEIGLRRAAARS